MSEHLATAPVIQLRATVDALGRMSRSEAAKALGKTQQTLANWATAGIGPKSFKVQGRCYYWANEIREFAGAPPAPAAEEPKHPALDPENAPFRYTRRLNPAIRSKILDILHENIRMHEMEGGEVVLLGTSLAADEIYELLWSGNLFSVRPKL